MENETVNNHSPSSSLVTEETISFTNDTSLTNTMPPKNLVENHTLNRGEKFQKDIGMLRVIFVDNFGIKVHLLLKAFVVCGIPFHTIENPFFL